MEKRKKEAFEKIQRKLKKINLQSWTEKKRLVKLIANGEALEPLVEFLKTTEAENRAGAREKERELERENDYSGENLLDD